ncbi:MAG: PAS domain-containing protein [Spirochaetales bacterium]|nr:PAS domain-containing protein [Spirochaetales bacterium]
MEEPELLRAILDSMHDPVVFVDLSHTIRYANKPAEKNFAKWGGITGKSIFHCHNENSCAAIKKIFKALKNGTEEEMISDNERHRTYMRAVRNGQGELIGYMERYEPPKGK